jgi:paired amphipathic helix protein Sin3a
VKPRLEKQAAAPLKDIQVPRPSLPAKKDYHSRPISELDLSACERCTPSYRLLPKNVSGAP